MTQFSDGGANGVPFSLIEGLLADQNADLIRDIERLKALKQPDLSAGAVEQAAIYAWEAAPSSMAGRFRRWNDMPDSEKDDWRKIALAVLTNGQG